MPCGSDKLNKRIAPAGERYRKRGTNIYQVSQKPLFRYAKDYQIGKGKSAVKFCLFVRVAEESDDMVEAELDRIAKEISKEEALKATLNATIHDFTYTQYFIEEAE